MARGKEALQAERARREAAMDHVRRLTDELVDYKLRTRRVEREAAATPGLRTRIAELTRQIEQADGPNAAALRREQERRRSESDEHQAAADSIRRLVIKVLRAPGVRPSMQIDEWDDLARVLGFSTSDAMFADLHYGIRTGWTSRRNPSTTLRVDGQRQREADRNPSSRAISLLYALYAYLDEPTDEKLASANRLASYFLDPKSVQHGGISLGEIFRYGHSSGGCRCKECAAATAERIRVTQNPERNPQ